MKKNINPLYYLEEAIGGAGARRVLKSAKKHKIPVIDIMDALDDKNTLKSNALADRIWAGFQGKIDKFAREFGKSKGQKYKRMARDSMKELQKDGSPLDKAISNRKPGDFVKQFIKDKAKRPSKERAQKGKELIDSLTK